MSYRRSVRSFALAVMAAAFIAPAAFAAEAVVFAAASLKNALDNVAADWAQASGEKATISYAASSALAKQIEQGAPADIFFSADLDWMDYLAERKLIDPATRKNLLGNEIVLVAHGADAKPVEIASGFDLAGALGGGKLAMASVDSVPAGKYGKAALESLGIWDSVAPSVAQADNVRAALQLVALGEAPLGIVYATDAHAEPKVSVVGTFPDDTHPPIVYPVARTSSSTSDAAKSFLDYLATPEARARFEAEGFVGLD
ncbi:MAG: molybdate ABC transporter substrate-binding protein [Amaricoccus sp.]